MPETSTAAAAAAPDASGARSSPGSVRAAADSPAASQSLIPLTVAQRAKAAAAALGAHCARFCRHHVSCTASNYDSVIPILLQVAAEHKRAGGLRVLGWTH